MTEDPTPENLRKNLFPDPLKLKIDWDAVDNDENTHGGGGLNPAGTTVTINNLKVVVSGDPADGDNALHPLPPTNASGGSGDVSCY